MHDLLDIGESLATVEIQGKKIAVPGVSARGIIYLFQRFPVIREALGKRGGVEIDRILEFGGDIVDAIIAAGIGHPGEEAYEAKVGKLGIEDQVALIDAIIRATLPKGPDSLRQMLERLGVLLNTAPSSSVPASKSRKRSTS